MTSPIEENSKRYTLSIPLRDYRLTAREQNIWFLKKEMRIYLKGKKYKYLGITVSYEQSLAKAGIIQLNCLLWSTFF